MNKIIATICISILTILLITPVVYAHSQHEDNTPGGEFTIYPSYEHNSNKHWIISEQPAGSTIKDFVTIENLTEKEISIGLKAVDAEEKENAFVVNENNTHAGSWISLPKEKYTLNPHEKKKIAIFISIPKDTNPGQYAGSILASRTKDSTQSLKITTRIGVRVYLTITHPSEIYASIFNSPVYIKTVFFILSLFALTATVFYNIIHILEQKNAHKKK